MKASELRMMIRKIVAEEIRQLAPVIVEEFLTEKYLKTIVEKRVAPVAKPKKKSELSELLTQNDDDGDVEDRIPRPPETEHDGIYQNKGPIGVAEQSARVRNKLLAADNPWSMIYEGVKPIAGDVSPEDFESVPERAPTQSRMASALSPTQQQFGEEGVPVDKLPGFSNRMQAILRKTEQRASNNGPMKSTESAEERRLAEHRRKLDEQVVGPRPMVK
jgi:hypothetical protein